ncbi:glycerophosphodiester phosphodiesterase family protein [Sulfitobacter geojensis]|jgi:glycerophosphoryl diester phosphodiesterase|uniref:Phosphodiesterase n=1 Tax=Sulfitobacter geojensis TaxID=1342299 RepID=A0AAE3B7T2_9RHOB|nr:glycerophosphodiester phosphodiesterase family protein [Sulfitobacter geojensis]MBM1690559.1 phosphodiesterase [Sulfitobacter geojensis]MBM1694625.1 phosphodiesterase [Sulfitobacter geojensis]MBM1706791.1 phosphodiesterase [Sulfitobacter geojensis]MBM1710849.1 phosphodiesterase [Sulfitobacter geojensis]MBM1714915.1 phosphodiesterase [Sulfitobacter geojensis]
MTLSRLFYDIPLAHRALHDVNAGRPENSRAAIRAAIDAGYGIEIDVQLSADDAAMVFHDYALDRLTDQTGPIRLRGANDLAKIPLKGGDEGIPDLPEVLALVAGRVPLVIELKDQDGAMGPNIGALEQATADAVATYAGPLAVMSFNPNSVARMAELLPEVPRGIVTSAYRYADWPLSRATCDHLRDIPDYDRAQACFISHEVGDLSAPRVAALKAQGAMICCWTVRSAAQEAEARKLADNITFEGYAAALDA